MVKPKWSAQPFFIWGKNPLDSFCSEEQHKRCEEKRSCNMRRMRTVEAFQKCGEYKVRKAVNDSVSQ